jgi:hypothetical protein
MRTGYLAFVTVFLSYSAYQGMNGVSGPPAAASKTASSAVSAHSLVLSHLVVTETFPTITGGMCSMALDQADPCQGCGAICPANGLKALVGDYFRGQTAEGDATARGPWNVPITQQKNIEFVFAAVPDPIHTHMALMFDREIENIQSAAQSSGYLFASSWMPWDISTHAESTDFTVRLSQSKVIEQIEALPGLMIFQKVDRRGTPKILFVFITGETPTGGFHVEQFENALKIRSAMLQGLAPDDHELKTLRIFGPTFSGSLVSLNTILNANGKHQFDRIVIRSGSVSSDMAVSQFCGLTNKEWPDSKNGEPPKDRPDFETLQVTDAYQEYYLDRFFDKREGLHFELAVLSEDETAFGNQGLATNEDDAVLTREGAPSSCSRTPVPRPHNLLRLYYPRGIAHLRDAYQQNLKAQASSENGKVPPQNGLPLTLTVTGNDDDTVAPFSPLQTPLSQESILQGIVTTMRMAHAKVVVIRAGDPLDTVFLAHYLRQNYPQARLVTVGADLLMIHAFFDPRFHGILAVTSYPLIAGADFASSGAEPGLKRVFPDSYSVGDYNAFLSLLASESSSPDGKLPLANYQQFGMPSFLQGPDTEQKCETWRAHLWLTTVGRDGYWPVSILDDPARGCAVNIPSVVESPNIKRPNSFAVHFSLGWMLFSTLSFCLTVALAALLAFPPLFTRSEVLARFNLQKSPGQNGLLFAAGMLLLVVQLGLSVPSIFWLGRFSQVSRHGSYVGVTEYSNGLPLNMLAFLISVAALGVGCHIGFMKRSSMRFARAASFACVIAILGVIAATIGFWSADLGTRCSSFIYRYIHVGSGVSPFLPLLFLLSAWVWWCWQSLTGIVSADEKQIALPLRSSFNASSLPDSAARVRLKAIAMNDKGWPWKTLQAIPNWEIPVYAALSLGIVCVFMRPSEIAEAFDSEPYKLLFWFLLYSCLYLVFYLAIHIVALWLDYRNLLRQIEMVPFHRGFGSLNVLAWKPLWKLAGSGRDQFIQLLREEVDALNRIQNSGLSEEGLYCAIDDAKIAMTKVSAEYENNPKSERVQGLFRELQVSLATTASEALIFADEQWQKEPYKLPVQKSDSGDSKDVKKPTEPAAEDRTLGAVEHFLCLFYLNVILVPLRRLQTLILALAGVFIFVLVAYSSYPFESRESFHALLISIFFGISLVVGVVYGQLFSNPLLSRITKTTPGELGLDFWVRLGTFVFIPLLSLLSVQFPELNDFLFSWLQPALQSIK